MEATRRFFGSIRLAVERISIAGSVQSVWQPISNDDRNIALKQLYQRVLKGSTLAAVELMRAHEFDHFFPTYSASDKEALLLKAARMGDSEAAIDLVEFRLKCNPEDTLSMLDALALAPKDSSRAKEIRL